jgi:hypothetical protein
VGIGGRHTAEAMTYRLEVVAEWSPADEVAEVEAKRLPFDDVDEWLAGRLSDYGHALSQIESAARAGNGGRLLGGAYGRTVAEEVEAFEQRSMRMHAYRMLHMSTREYAQVRLAEPVAV